MRADVQAGGFLGRLPEVAVEGPLAPEAAAGRWEEELAVGAIEVGLGFEHPGERWRDRDDAAGVGLAVIGLRALEDLALVGGAADLERLAVEVFAAEGQHLPQPQAAVGEDADHCLVAARSLGEAVHLLKGEEADRS